MAAPTLNRSCTALTRFLSKLRLSAIAEPDEPCRFVWLFCYARRSARSVVFLRCPIRFRANRSQAVYSPSECAGLCTWERRQELRLIQVSLATFSAHPCYNVSTQQCVFRRTEQMASTEPSMTEQHTCSAAALPEGAFLPAGPQCPGHHPESGAAGSAGALFCARALVTQAAAVCKYAQEGC